MMIDDPDRAAPNAWGLVIDAMSGIFAARDALIEEQAQLGPGTVGIARKLKIRLSYS